MDNNLVVKELREHYSKKFDLYGAKSQGVDWGENEENLLLRYKKMFDLMKSINSLEKYSVLDVGCGFGGFYKFISALGINIEYTGIDVCKNMIDYARNEYKNAKFICDDFYNYKFEEKFDYIICNGILTQKLNTSILDMEIFSQNLIKKMYDLCNKGVAFNIMTSKVNFMVDNLYYKSPIEMMAFCMNFTNKLSIDHSYPLYEYTTYLYK